MYGYSFNYFSDYGNQLFVVLKTLEVLIFAFTSRSSAGALPLNVQTQTQRLGVPEGIANFSASFGLSLAKMDVWYLSSNACYYGLLLLIMLT